MGSDQSHFAGQGSRGSELVGISAGIVGTSLGCLLFLEDHEPIKFARTCPCFIHVDPCKALIRSYVSLTGFRAVFSFVSHLKMACAQLGTLPYETMP